MTTAIVVLGAALGAGGCSGDDRADAGTGPHRLRAEQVAVLGDGRVLVAGVSDRRSAGSGCNGELAVVALDRRGKVDASFGSRPGLERVRPEGGSCVTSVIGLAQDPRGRTLVGFTRLHRSDGSFDDNSSQSGQLLRLTTRGRRDDTFADDLRGFRFAVSPDGSIFDADGERFGPDGARDPRDDKEFVRVAVDLASDVAAQPDGGKLFLGGRSRRDDRRLAVQRFGADWRPDTAFGEASVASADVAPGADLGGGEPDLLRVMPAPRGAVIAFGVAFTSGRTVAFAIRFDAAGRLDRSFGKGGRIDIGPATADKDAFDIDVRSDGRLVAIGSVGRRRARRLFVASYDARGRPDRRFGGDGRVTLDVLRVPRDVDARRLGRGEDFGAIAAGPGGTTVGVASLVGGRFGVTSVAFRLTADGRLDRGFGRRGVTSLRRLG